MSILMTLRIALKALNRNKMRTILTMLGMIIGVGAVITMVALGTGARTTIEERVKSAGTNMIMVNAGNFSTGGVRMGQGNSTTMTPEDATMIKGLPGVQYVGIPQFQDVGTRCTEQFSSVIAGQLGIDDALSACQDIASQVS